jgi:hypothetical protein
MVAQHVLTALANDSYPAARLVACELSEYTDGHQIKALATRQEWTTDGLVEDCDNAITGMSGFHHGAQDQTALRALKTWAAGTWTNSYRGTSGHDFHQDHTGEEVCGWCSGRWEIAHSDPESIREGRYRTRDGDDPSPCPGIDLVHGDRHENGHELECDGECPHCRHTCNCLVCTG